MATIKGIDVSKYQGNVDFAKVKAAGINYVIIRAGYGKLISQKDPYFEQNYKNAKAAGLGVGAYWYSYASSTAEAKTEAQVCMQAIKGKQFEYPIYFDLEEQSQFKKGKSFCDSLVTTFCNELEKAGYYAGLYISRSPLQAYISDSVAKKYALWIAEYNSKCNYSGTYGMWQYSSAGKVNGVSGNVDMDYCYFDYPSIIKSNGCNGFTKSSTTATTKTLDTTGFKKGDSGNGVLALKKLILLAYRKKITTVHIDASNSYNDKTVSAVNALLKKWGYKQNGIAGKEFITQLYKALM